VRPRRLARVVVRPLNFTVRTRVDVLLIPAFGFLGFFAGTLFGTQMIRWGALLWVTTTAHGGDFLGPPKRRLLWAFPFVLLLHPGPYLIVLAVVVTAWVLQGRVGSPWLSFLGGFYVYIAFVSLKLFQVYRIQRRRRASAGPNNHSRGP
jgi:hypothetical protein